MHVRIYVRRQVRMHAYCMNACKYAYTYVFRVRIVCVNINERMYVFMFVCM